MATVKEQYPDYTILPGKARSADMMTDVITIQDKAGDRYYVTVDDKGQTIGDKASVTNPPAPTGKTGEVQQLAAPSDQQWIYTQVGGKGPFKRTRNDNWEGGWEDAGAAEGQPEKPLPKSTTTYQKVGNTLWKFVEGTNGTINQIAVKTDANAEALEAAKVTDIQSVAQQRVDNKNAGKGALSDLELDASDIARINATTGTTNAASGTVDAQTRKDAQRDSASVDRKNADTASRQADNAVELTRINDQIVKNKKAVDDHTMSIEDEANARDILNDEMTRAVQEANRLSLLAASSNAGNITAESVRHNQAGEKAVTDAAAAAVLEANAGRTGTASEGALQRASAERIAAGVRDTSSQGDETLRRGQDVTAEGNRSSLVGQATTASMNLLGQSMQFAAPTGTAANIAGQQNYMMDQDNWKKDAPKIETNARAFAFDPTTMARQIMEGLWGSLASVSPGAAEKLKNMPTAPGAAPTTPGAPGPGQVTPAPVTTADGGGAQPVSENIGSGAAHTPQPQEDWMAAWRKRQDADVAAQRIQAQAGTIGNAQGEASSGEDWLTAFRRRQDADVAAQHVQRRIDITAPFVPPFGQHGLLTS